MPLRNVIDRIARKVRGHLDPRLFILLVMVIGVILAGSALNHWNSRQAAEPTLQPTYTSVVLESGTPQATPLPLEYLQNDRQTIGPTLAALALVLIVVIGVIRADLQPPGEP